MAKKPSRHPTLSFVAPEPPESLMQTFSAMMKSEDEPSRPAGKPHSADADVPEENTLVKSILDLVNKTDTKAYRRLSFETDPQINNQYQAVYRQKVRLIPDVMLKQILIKDDLVAAIVRVRETQISSFGRPRESRFDSGFLIEPRVGVLDKLNPEQKIEMDRRIERARDLFATCGSTENVKKKDRLSFSQYLQMSTRNAVGLGRLATEIIQTDDLSAPGKKKFHSFRPSDAGTMFKATSQKTAADNVRRQAMLMLERLKNEKFEPEKFSNDEYSWIQVIDGQVVQAFHDDEMLVHNFFPVVDVELDGYPVTPIDTMIAAVTTHINITKHNQIYFQTGRAARGMLVFKSDEVDDNVLNRIKQQFMAAINSVDNAWRMPTFSIGTNDDISWQPIDNSSRDAEFQYLTDMNARVIFAAFQISPDEVPGWSYLSRGTNNQGLSESNNEYKLEAARDVGIRPLLTQFEDFINEALFPLIDATLATLCRLKLVGLDAETEEKESVRLQQDAPVHGTYDWILGKVEKKPVGREWGGEFPLNPQYQAILDKYYKVKDIRKHFMGIDDPPEEAAKWDYARDPFYFQNLQLQMQQQQMVQQAQAQAQASQQASAGGGAPPAGGKGGGDAGGGPQPESSGASGDQPDPSAQPEQSGQGQPPTEGAPGEDLTRSIDQAIAVLTKGESDLPPSKRALLAQHRKTIEKFRLGLENDLREATASILSVAARHVDKRPTKGA